MRLGFIVPRYGAEARGELPGRARDLAEGLAARGRAVAVFTTTALDPSTWESVLPAGVTREGPVEVRRYAPRPGPCPPRPGPFEREALPARPGRDEVMWLEGRGPVVPELVGQLRRRVEDFEALVFFTYSSWTTIRGLEAAQGRTLLVPAEPWGPHLQLPLVSRAFRQAAAVAFDTEEERVQAERVLGEPLAAAEVVGRGIPAVPAAPAATDLRSGAAPYVLLAGRLEAEDGCAATIERFMRRQRDGRSSLTLVLVGRGRVELHETPSVRHLGELPEAETRAMMAGARAVLVPSRREALAPLALEAWRESRPVLATGGSEVMRGVVERAGGGIACRGYDELAAALDLLEEEPALFDALGRQGRLYLETEHALPRVLDRYERILARLADRAAAA